MGCFDTHAHLWHIPVWTFVLLYWDVPPPCNSVGFQRPFHFQPSICIAADVWHPIEPNMGDYGNHVYTMCTKEQSYTQLFLYTNLIFISRRDFP